MSNISVSAHFKVSTRSSVLSLIKGSLYRFFFFFVLKAYEKKRHPATATANIVYLGLAAFVDGQLLAFCAAPFISATKRLMSPLAVFPLLSPSAHQHLHYCSVTPGRRPNREECHCGVN